MTIPTCLLAVALADLVVGIASARAAPADPCLDSAHRFETFALAAPSLGRSKQILVYLPPGYDCTPGRRYPTFYFNDGHDLFDWNPFAGDLEPALAAEIAAREAWYGSWHLEAQLDRAIADGRLPPMIVVGIAADDGQRSRDLAPVPWRGSSEARGIHYGRFVTETVLAAADRRFRTIPNRRCRGIGGASLGGVSALQIGLAHPDRFGLVLAFSPVLADPAIAGYMAAAWPDSDPAGPARFLIDFDNDPIGKADRDWLAAIVGRAAKLERQTTLAQSPQARHTIASWAERVIPALSRLLDGQCGG